MFEQVEVIMATEGKRGSYYAGQITDRLSAWEFYRVQFNELTQADGTPEEAVVHVGQLRPRQPVLIQAETYNKGEHVDVFKNGGWWYGKVEECGRQDMYEVDFSMFGRPSRRAYKADIRLHFEWKRYGWEKPSGQVENIDSDSTYSQSN